MQTGKPTRSKVLFKFVDLKTGSFNEKLAYGLKRAFRENL